MSLIKRFFGKSPPEPAAPTTSAAVAPPAPKPRPDTTAQSREEEAGVAQAIAAGDAAALGKWVLDGSSTRVRQQAAEAIIDPDQLRELIRATRGGNDKNVYRILTARRDAQAAEERDRRQLAENIDAAAAAVLRHAHRPYDALYEATLAQIESRWQALAEHASLEAQRAVAANLQRARDVIEQHRQSVAAESVRQQAAAQAAEEARQQRELEAQAAATEAAERVKTRESEREAERADGQARREAQDAEARTILGLLRQAQAALEQGGSARAARLRAAIEEKRPQSPSLPPWFDRKLQEVDARIAELQDWRTFTVVPKRGELVQRMQSLVGADMAPEELARQIRRLRDEWRTLHRGAAEEPSPEQQKFDDAAEKAYEPCRAHFGRLAELRQANQAHREAVLQRLAAFAGKQAGDEFDWRAVQQVIGEARREWQQYAPVDQAVAKPLQDRFHAQLDELHARLDAEFARNVEARRRLIARAAGLAAMGDTRQAMDEARNLQREWKAVGPVARNQDGTLWDEFRQHCNGVFERSSHEYAAHGATLDAHAARAVALCESLEQIAGTSGEALQAGLHQANELRAEFDTLDLPRATARELSQRFARASDRCHDAMRRQRAAEAERGWSDLFDAAAHVREYALAATSGGPADECEGLRAAAASAVAALAHAPKNSRAVLEQQLAHVANGSLRNDFAANAAALRMLCIRAELVADVATPEEDLPLRREYQMQRLVQSMERGERVTPAELDDLALEWIAVGPVDAADYEPLFARFGRCRDRSQPRNS